jgi:hypothetical protein
MTQLTEEEMRKRAKEGNEWEGVEKRRKEWKERARELLCR